MHGVYGDERGLKMYSRRFVALNHGARNYVLCVYEMMYQQIKLMRMEKFVRDWIANFFEFVRVSRDCDAAIKLLRGVTGMPFFERHHHLIFCQELYSR